MSEMIDGMELGTRLETALRQAAILVAADRENLLSEQAVRLPTSPRDDSAVKVALAAEALGLAGRDDTGALRWAAGVRAETRDADQRQRLCSILNLYAAYISLAASGEQAPSLAPKDQLDADPRAYKRFLEAVHVSNIEHAGWVVSRPVFSTAKTLVDVGGGYGTFALAWVGSSDDRDAVIVDLPGVAELSPAHPRIARVSADLLESREMPSDGDVYFFANVLHLLPNWRDALSAVTPAARNGAMLAVYEARPDDTAGRWFDLQVHLRSGRVAGLLDPAEIEDGLAAITGRTAERFSYVAADDFLHREFQLTVARIAG
jgi:hypothetical protein